MLLGNGVIYCFDYVINLLIVSFCIIKRNHVVF